MHYFHNFLTILYQYLTQKDVSNSNIIRKHTRELEKLGDLSFPLSISNWQHIIQCNDIETILQYLSLQTAEFSLESLINKSKTWPLHISKCIVQKTNVHIYLERMTTFADVIKTVHIEGDRYGNCDLNMHDTVCLMNVPKYNANDTDLTKLRLLLLRDIASNLLKFCNVDVTDSENNCNIKITFTNSIKSNDLVRVISCGPVLNDKGTKDTETTAEAFFKKRTVDMRLMAEHKYGLRKTAQTGWKEFFEKLGEAAVIIELLQNKPSHSTKININDPSFTNSKGASFILYNCARLAALFKEFDTKVCLNMYPQLPDLDSIDFTLLTQAEEWELLYVYVLQYPMVIKNCIEDFISCKFNPHFLITMLSGLSSTFSVYYRRVRILTESRDYLFPVLHARIALLKAVERVLHNSLRLLNIQPVKQM